MKIRFVENWKDAWKWFSVHVATVLTVLNTLQATVPQVQAFISPTQLAVINSTLGVLVIWVRMIAQSKKQ